MTSQFSHRPVLRNIFAVNYAELSFVTSAPRSHEQHHWQGELENQPRTRILREWVGGGWRTIFDPRRSDQRFNLSF